MKEFKVKCNVNFENFSWSSPCLRDKYRQKEKNFHYIGKEYDNCLDFDIKHESDLNRLPMNLIFIEYSRIEIQGKIMSNEWYDNYLVSRLKNSVWKQLEVALNQPQLFHYMMYKNINSVIMRIRLWLVYRMSYFGHSNCNKSI